MPFKYTYKCWKCAHECDMIVPLADRDKDRLCPKFEMVGKDLLTGEPLKARCFGNMYREEIALTARMTAAWRANG